MLQLQRQRAYCEGLSEEGKIVSRSVDGGPAMVGYAVLPDRPPMPCIKVFIKHVGEVEGIIDSGASISLVRCSLVRKFLKPDRIPSDRKIRGANNALVYIDSFLPLEVDYMNRVVKLEEVAVVRSSPFAVILGLDWIISSRTNLIVRGNRLVPEQSSDSDAVRVETVPVARVPTATETSKTGVNEAPKKKRVRFAGILDYEAVGIDEDEGPVISDELIEDLKKDRAPGRDQGAQVVKLKKRVTIPSGSMVFIKMELGCKKTGTAMIKSRRCSKPGHEWVVPSCLVTVTEGKFKVPVLNLTQSPLRLERGETLTQVDTEIKGTIQVVEDKSEQTEHVACTATDKGFDSGLADARLGENLSDEEREKVRNLLRRHERCFPSKDGHFGQTKEAVHTIETGDAQPVFARPYRVSAFERQIIAKKVDDMLRRGVITPSFSPWSSPVVLVKKPGKDHRFCVDYRRLNAVTKRDVYPLPLMEDVFDRVAGSRYFSSIDLQSGYHQVPVAPEDQCKTAFVTPDGFYEFKRLPFGLNNAPSTFQRLMDRVLGSLKWNMCLVYLDDILVFGRTFEEHQERLELVLKALGDAGLTCNVAKCLFATDKVLHLGHVIDREGMRPNFDKVQALTDFRIKDVKSLRGFLGLASFYRRFVPNFASIAHPLHGLLRKNAEWTWGPAQEKARQALSDCLTSAPLLAHFDNKLEIVIQTDASHTGLGAVLMQDGGEGLKPVVYISRRLSDAESRYHANELECLAIVWAIKKLRSYIYGRRFSVRTDSSAVKWLCTKKEVTGKFARWILSLQEYDFDIAHVKGVDNAVADALSRFPSESAGDESSHVVCVLQDTRSTGYRAHELAFQQQLDAGLRSIIALMMASPKGGNSLEFRLQNGVLYKKNTGQGRKFLLCIPSILRRKVLESCHDDALSGHMGVEKTMARVSERYWWPKYRSSVKKYVSSCLYCQMHKHMVGLPVGELNPIPPPERPFESIGMDHLGPFRLTSGGNKHIIVCIDYLTKWVEAAAVPDTSSKYVIKFLRENILCRHSTPARAISDQGTAFTSQEMDEAMTKWGIKHVFATPEHPQTSGLVERANRTLTLALAAYVNADHTDWDFHLPAAVFAINTARQSTTEVTPFQMVYGRLPHTALENEFPWPESAPETYERFVERVQALRKSARIVIQQKQEKTRLLVNRRRRVVEDLHQGELVLVRRNLKKKDRTKKLLPKFIGPFQVVRKVCPTTYLVEDLPAKRRKKTFRRFQAHVVQIRRFHPREDNEWDDWPEEEVLPTEEDQQDALPIQQEIEQEPDPVPPAPVITTRSGRKVNPPVRHQDYVKH